MLTNVTEAACLRPEEELLLCCARASPDSLHAEHLEALLRINLDWDYLLRMAAAHELTSLVHWHLHTVCPDRIPKAFSDYLRSRFRANALRNLFLTGELFTLLDIFAGQDIPVIPFKGPLLASTIYKNLALREFSDLDILVHPQDAPRALELLLAQGYRKRFAHGNGLRFLKQNRECALVRQDGKSGVDLHWGLTPATFPWKSNHEGLWDRLEPVILNGREILNLSSEDLLVFLCVHGAKHQWTVLKLLCDVAELINSHPRMDWKRVMDHASRSGGERMLLLGLSLAHVLLGTVLPKDVLHTLQANPKTQSLARQVRRQLFQEADRDPGVLTRQLFQLKMSTSLWARVRCSLITLTAPTEADWRTLPLPSFLYPVYYLLRPIRLVVKYGRRAITGSVGVASRGESGGGGIPAVAQRTRASVTASIQERAADLVVDFSGSPLPGRTKAHEAHCEEKTSCSRLSFQHHWHALLHAAPREKESDAVNKLDQGSDRRWSSHRKRRPSRTARPRG